MFKQFTVITCLLAPLPAFAADYRLDLIAESPQVSRMEQGEEAIDSHLDTTAIRVYEPSGWMEGLASFDVVVYNGGSEPFNFGSENVNLVLPDGSKRRMAPYSYLVKRERSRQKRRGFGGALLALARGLQASNAGRFDGTINTNTGRQVGTFSGTESGSAAIAQMMAEQQTREDQEAIQRQNAAGMAKLSGVLRTTTVDPGDAFGGTVLFSLPKRWQEDGTYPVNFEITAGSETHVIAAKLTRK